MCQVLPMVPAAEGHQVDQLEPASLPTEGGRESCGRIFTEENGKGVERAFQHPPAAYV